MFAIDWTLMLRVVEAVGPAVSTLVAIPLAAYFAVRGFRAQKTIERRADWYQKVHRDLVQLLSAHAMAAVPAGSVGKVAEGELVRSVQSAQLAFIASSEEAMMYAERGALTAVMALRHELESLAEDEAKGLNTLARLFQTTAAIHEASDAVAAEFRADMRMSRLPLKQLAVDYERRLPKPTE